MKVTIEQGTPAEEKLSFPLVAELVNSNFKHVGMLVLFYAPNSGVIIKRGALIISAETEPGYHSIHWTRCTNDRYWKILPKESKVILQNS